jgi:hypothetical protein
MVYGPHGCALQAGANKFNEVYDFTPAVLPTRESSSALRVFHRDVDCVWLHARAAPYKPFRRVCAAQTANFTEGGAPAVAHWGALPALPAVMTVEIEGSTAVADSPLQLDGTASAAAAAKEPSVADGVAKALLKKLDGRATNEGEGPLLKVVAYGLM